MGLSTDYTDFYEFWGWDFEGGGVEGSGLGFGREGFEDLKFQRGGEFCGDEQTTGFTSGALEIIGVMDVSFACRLFGRRSWRRSGGPAVF